jgi:plastocyanin
MPPDFYSIIIIIPLTIMAFMKFAEKCPKCGGFVQTKSVRKSIGLGSIEIPVAQFCLNPVCDWYQDFAETKRPEDIKEGFQLKIPSMNRKLPVFKKPEFKKPEISKNQMIAISAIIGLIIIYALFSYFVYDTGSDVNQKPQPSQPEFQNNASTVSSETPNFPVPTTVFTPMIIEPKSYTIRVDVSHGFYPEDITINKSDTIIWSNEENQRTRVILVSKNNLFEKQLMLYPDRFQYQFNRKGNYSFVLAEFPTNIEYQKAKGIVIVK